MGIHSRDYVRDNRPDGTFGNRSAPWAIKFLLIANIVVFLLQTMTSERPGPTSVGGVTQLLSLNLGDLFPSFQLWRLVTYGFCHGSINHIAVNLFVLWMFGRTVEPIYGSREFLAFYLAAVVVSGLCHVGFQVAQQSSVGVVGASGGVMAIVFLTAMHYPKMTVLLMFVIPVELRWIAIMYALADVFGLFHQGASVAHMAHLGGAAFGVAYKFYGWQVLGMWGRVRGGFRSRVVRSRPKVRIYQPTTEEPSGNLDKQVDVILQKIHEQGESSLTSQERKILKAASNRYKKR
jgi:membrane associated rhomboid family serine protease